MGGLPKFADWSLPQQDSHSTPKETANCGHFIMGREITKALSTHIVDKIEALKVFFKGFNFTIKLLLGKPFNNSPY
jgi:hypothetical protein